MSGVELLGHMHFHAAINEAANDRAAGFDLGKFEARILESKEGFAEGFALLGIADRRGQGGFDRRRRTDSDD